jgi:hypothetical protein
MRLRDLFTEIESTRYSVNYTVISGFRVFQNALDEDATLRKLIEHLKVEPSDQNKVVDRLRSLLRSPHEPDLQHPFDVALAAYLFVLSRTNYTAAYECAKVLAQEANLWWARRVANMLVETMSTAEVSIDVGQSSGPTVRFMGASTETVLVKNRITSVSPSIIPTRIVLEKVS